MTDWTTPPLGEAVAQRAADPLAGVAGVGLVAEDAEQGAEVPVVAGRVDVVIDGDEARAAILGRLADLVGLDAAAEPGEVLGDDQVERAGLDQLLGLGELLAVKVL